MSRTTQPLRDLFGGRTLRFSDFERAIPGVSQKVLAQELRQLEREHPCKEYSGRSVFLRCPRKYASLGVNS
jgi:DNA-binding HxlR family transcriptional regulator